MRTLKKFAVLASLVLSGCVGVDRAGAVSKSGKLTVALDEGVKLDHDQLLVCAYISDKGALVCMLPENAHQ